VPTPEARAASQQTQVRLDPHHARLVTPACARCGAQAEHGVMITDPPTALDLNSQLAALEESDFHGRIRIERKFAALAQAAREAGDQLQAAEQAWRTEHPSCPEGTPPIEDEPELVTDVPLYWRMPAIRTLR
jgi:hypothetical protein